MSAARPQDSSGTADAWGRWSGANYFFEDLIESFPIDSAELSDVAVDVDVEVNNSLEYFSCEFSQGTVHRLKKRIQLVGDCTRVSGGRIVCPLTLKGLMVSYKSVVLAPATPSRSLEELFGFNEKKTTADLFVKEGLATLTLSQEQDGKRKLALKMNSLEMAMQPRSEILVNADVDKMFVQETTKRCERELWQYLEDAYAECLTDYMQKMEPSTFEHGFFSETD